MTLADYGYIFLQSNFIEIIVFYIFYRNRMSFVQVLILTSLANSITHPVVFFGFMKSGLSYLVAVCLAEIFAVIVETFLHGHYGKLNYRRTALASLAANLVSWNIAPLLTYFVFLR